MLEILNFIFSSFWHWAGTVILILAIGVSLNSVIVAFRGKAVRFINLSST